jgi:hypothetical protein
VLRPTYKEGQILGATDLNTQLDYERLNAVLHERTEHLWGVAQGLGLDVIERTLNDAAKTKYVDVNLAPGRAVDRLGRSIVISEAIPLDPDLFKQQITKPDAQMRTWYPVFVQAIEVPRAGETAPGKCSVALTTRIEESLQVSFGSPGEEIAVLDQQAATVDEAFGTPALNDKVLVGWVKFNPGTGIQKFTEVATQANGIRVRYVGVVASDVVAGGGELTLHTRPGGARYAIQLVEDSAGGCKLKFGKQDGNGAITAVFSVDEQGAMTYGSLTPAPVASTAAESGIAFDGVTLPLPADVTEAQVNQGTVRLHILLTPWAHTPMLRTLPFTNPPGLKLALPFVVKCSVDADRKVRCSVRWQDPGDDKNFVVAPSACTYVIVASGKK